MAETNAEKKRGKGKTEAQWAEIVARARQTGKMANTLMKALAQRYAYRWQFIDFRGPGGQESRGIVDILAIRKSSKKPFPEGLKSLDAFDIILIQVKGGSGKKLDRPTQHDIERLKIVGERYHAQAIVLFEWNKTLSVTRFLELDDQVSLPNDPWQERSALNLFGKPSKAD
jgi:hypothetical protein